MSNRFGRYFAKVRREHSRVSLRKFCEKHGFDPGNISKLERGKLPPPASREKLVEYATALGLEEGDEEWLQFFDYAAATRGEIPPELLADEEVADKLPLLFRTLRGDRVDEDDLDDLIEMIRRA